MNSSYTEYEKEKGKGNLLRKNKQDKESPQHTYLDLLIFGQAHPQESFCLFVCFGWGLGKGVDI